MVKPEYVSDARFTTDEDKPVGFDKCVHVLLRFSELGDWKQQTTL